MKGLKLPCRVNHRQTRNSLLRRIAAGKPPAIVKAWPQPDNCPLPYLGLEGSPSEFPQPTQDTLNPQEQRGEGLSEEEIDYPIQDGEQQHTHTTLDEPEGDFQEESQEEDTLDNWEEPNDVVPQETIITPTHAIHTPHSPDQAQSARLGTHDSQPIHITPQQDPEVDMNTQGTTHNTHTTLSNPSSSGAEVNHNTDNYSCPACGTFVFAGGAHCLNPHCVFWLPPGRAGEGFDITQEYPPSGIG